MARGFPAYWSDLRRAIVLDIVIVLSLFLLHAIFAAIAIALIGVAAALIAWRGRPGRGHGQGWPPGSLGIGVLPQIEPDYFFDSLHRYGPVFKTHFFDQPMVAVIGMREGAELLREPALGPNRLPYDRYIPDSLIRWMESPVHERYRQALGPLLGSRLLRPSQGLMDRAVDRGLTRMASAGDAGPAPEALPLLARDLVFETWVPMLVGIKPDSARFAELHELYDVINVSWPRTDAEIRPALDRIDALIRDNEAERTAAADRGETVAPCALTELWRLRSEGLDEQTTLRNLIYLIETTGHDTAGLLMWLLKNLGDHPKWLDALRARGNESQASDESDARGRLALANRIVSESVRLEQSEFILRQATADIRFRGYVIPQGWAVRICTHESHRDPELFPDPNRFDPDRFLDSAPREGDYAPFGVGDRSCTGAGMTRALARTFICELAAGYDLEVLDDGPRALSCHRHWAPNPHFRVRLTPRGEGR